MHLGTTLAIATIYLPFGVVMYIEGGLKGNSEERNDCENIKLLYLSGTVKDFFLPEGKTSLP